MIRNFIGIMAGLIAVVFFLTALLFVGWQVFPLPEDVFFLQPKTYENLDSNIHTGTYIVEILAYTISAFLGGMVVAAVVKNGKRAYSMLIGIILVFFVIIKFIYIHHPFWFNLVSIIPILPMGYLGGKLVDKISTRDTHQT